MSKHFKINANSKIPNFGEKHLRMTSLKVGWGLNQPGALTQHVQGAGFQK